MAVVQHEKSRTTQRRRPPPDRPEPDPDKDRKDKRDHDDREHTLTPFLLIPYSTSDLGVRPLTAPTIFWKCPAIHFDGQPFTGAPLSPSDSIKLSLLVRNIGTLGTSGVARFYWADPTAGGFSASTVHLIGQAPFYCHKGEVLETDGVPWTPGNAVPSHVCLLAEVTCAADAAPGSFDAFNDRHYAQQNLAVQVVAPGGTALMNFTILNPAEDSGAFTITARSLVAEQLAELARMFRAKPLEFSEERLGLRVVHPGEFDDGKPSITVKLRPHSKELCQLMVRVPEEITPETFIALEIIQSRRTKSDRKGEIMGGVGLVIFGSPR